MRLSWVEEAVGGAWRGYLLLELQTWPGDLVVAYVQGSWRWGRRLEEQGDSSPPSSRCTLSMWALGILCAGHRYLCTRPDPISTSLTYPAPSLPPSLPPSIIASLKSQIWSFTQYCAPLILFLSVAATLLLGVKGWLLSSALVVSTSRDCCGLNLVLVFSLSGCFHSFWGD